MADIEITKKGNNLFSSSEDPRIVRFPHPTKYKINHDECRIGDVWGTTGAGIISWGIKLRTYGNPIVEKPSHVGIICKIQNQFFICEALSDGIRLSSLYAYLDPKFPSYSRVCAILRPKNIKEEHRQHINNQCLSLAADFPSYGYKSILGFIVPFTKPKDVPEFMNNKSMKLVCSESVSFILRSTDPILDLVPSKKDSVTAPSDIYNSSYADNIFNKIITI